MTETRREQTRVQARQPGLGEVSQQCPISQCPHYQDRSGNRKLLICLQMQIEWAALEYVGSGLSIQILEGWTCIPPVLHTLPVSPALQSTSAGKHRCHCYQTHDSIGLLHGATGNFKTHTHTLWRCTKPANGAALGGQPLSDSAQPGPGSFEKSPKPQQHH